MSYGTSTPENLSSGVCEQHLKGADQPAMRGSRNFRQEGGGGGVQVCMTKKKALTTIFFLSSAYHFSRFRRGSNIFQGGGGPTFSRGRGSNCLFPIETHRTSDFPGGGGGSGPPVPPLDPHLHAHLRSLIGAFVIR